MLESRRCRQSGRRRGDVRRGLAGSQVIVSVYSVRLAVVHVKSLHQVQCPERRRAEVNTLVYRTLQRLKHLDNPVFHRTFRQVEREEWLGRDELAELAWERQKALVRQAYMHSPFYRGKYDTAGFHPDHLQHPEDFVRVPLLTRDEVREHIEDIICDNASRARLVNGTRAAPPEFP